MGKYSKDIFICHENIQVVKNLKTHPFTQFYDTLKKMLPGCYKRLLSFGTDAITDILNTNFS